MMWLLVAALLLSPHVDEPTPLRLVSDGTGGEPVRWMIEGNEVARTHDGQAALIDVEPGTHDLVATTGFDGPWRVLVRPAPSSSGVLHVSAWAASHEPPPPQPFGPGRLLPVGLAAMAVGVLWWPSKQP